jgi:hypothetical protein
MKGIMEMRKMRMRGSPLWPDRPTPAPGDEQGEQGRSGGAFWSREKETREGEGTEERGLGTKKTLVACPYGTARPRVQGGGDVAAGQFDAKPRVLLARFSNVSIHKYMYKHSFAKLKKTI